MNKMSEGLINKIIRFSPSFFDVAACAYLLFIAFWPNKYEIRLMFNLGVIFMLSTTLFLKPLREYKSLSLALIVIWTFISIFIHSYKPDYTHETIIFKYLNIFVLSEGFIYVFSGAFLFYLIIRYSKSVWLYAITIAACLMPYLKTAQYHGKMSPIVGLLLAVFIYSIMNHKYLITKLSVGVVGLGAVALYTKWLMADVAVRNVIYYKITCRPYVWIQLWRHLEAHWVLGTGFPHYLGVANLFWVGKIGDVEQGWLFRHNDYMGLGVYLGAIVIVLLLWLVMSNIYKIRHHPAVIGLLTVSIIPLIQCTMFDVYKASLFLAIGAICVRVGLPTMNVTDAPSS